MKIQSEGDRSRRDFFRRLSWGAATLAGGWKLGGAELETAGGGNRKLGVALLGLGNYAGGELAPALRKTKSCYLAGVVTGHPEKARRWATDYGLPKKNIYSYENFDSIADNRDIDIVYVVTPPALHPEFVIRAAKAGKHVISEKPMATSVADCERMIAACKAANVKLGVGYRLHYDLYHQELMRLAKDDQMGPFLKMSGTRSFVIGQHAWRIEKKLAGGGPMMDLGIYVVHGACMAANGATPLAVTARELPKKRPEMFNEVEETLEWTMEFPNGAVCNGVTSFNGAGGDKFRAEGEKGWIDFKQHAFTYRGIGCETSRGPLNFPAISQQGAQMDDFAESILNNRPIMVPGELGLRDMKIITAVYEAARTGKRVLV